MEIYIFIFFIIFIAVVAIGISFLLITLDKENRRMKGTIDGQKAKFQNNAQELEKFYAEKKQILKDKDDAVATIEALLQDERNISAMAVRNSEMAKSQLRQQQEEISKSKSQIDQLNQQLLQANETRVEEISKLRLEIQRLSAQLQQANETRLIEVQKEAQKWTETLQSKEITLQKLGAEASSIESVMDTLGLISKEMNRRLDEHYSKMKLLDEKAQENLELMAQLEH